jgi:hypothetical protein
LRPEHLTTAFALLLLAVAGYTVSRSLPHLLAPAMIPGGPMEAARRVDRSGSRPGQRISPVSMLASYSCANSRLARESGGRQTPGGCPRPPLPASHRRRRPHPATLPCHRLPSTPAASVPARRGPACRWQLRR